MKLGFFASHNGSNMQAIIDACKNKQLNSIPSLVISNNSMSGALQRAKSENIPCYHLSSSTHPDYENLVNEIIHLLKQHEIDLIILAGYMKLLPKKVINIYQNRILNIHPALLPKYGGKGFYGKNVHQAVIDAKEKYTGVTIHIVNEDYDDGRILNQCRIQIDVDDTVDTLAQKVLSYEHKIFIETIKLIEKGKIVL